MSSISLAVGFLLDNYRALFPVDVTSPNTVLFIYSVPAHWCVLPLKVVWIAPELALLWTQGRTGNVGYAESPRASEGQLKIEP
jgi:hypothetical protein